MDNQVVLDFIEAINKHDVDEMTSLMDENHVFINSHGKKTVGKYNMEQGWKGYFEFFPDYTIEVSEITENESVIGVFGTATATYMNKKNKQNSNYWCLPGAWKAIVKDGKIKLWQVFADTKVPYDIIEENIQ
jgi:ketosteroid isomerase-like protein